MPGLEVAPLSQPKEAMYIFSAIYDDTAPSRQRQREQLDLRGTHLGSFFRSAGNKLCLLIGPYMTEYGFAAQSANNIRAKCASAALDSV